MLLHQRLCLATTSVVLDTSEIQRSARLLTQRVCRVLLGMRVRTIELLFSVAVGNTVWVERLCVA